MLLRKFFIVLLLVISAACQPPTPIEIPVTSGPPENKLHSFSCADHVIVVNPEEGYEEVVDEACETYEAMTNTVIDPYRFRNIYIEFRKEGEPWDYCFEMSLTKKIRGCAGRNRIELRSTDSYEDWKGVLRHEITHVLMFRYQGLTGNDEHHQWMSLNSLCYGYCGEFNIIPRCNASSFHPDPITNHYPPLSFDICSTDPVCPHRNQTPSF